jgi:hypothetical protein
MITMNTATLTYRVSPLYAAAFLLACCVATLLLVPSHAFALEVQIDPTERVYVPGDQFLVPIRLDTKGECVNAVSVEVLYDTDLLTAVDVSTGRSILTLWTQSPVISQESGTIQFAGGIPGGYCGRLQGDPGLTNILAEIVFSAQDLSGTTTAQAQVALGQVVIYAHDGRGTILPVTSRSATLELSTETEIPATNEWIERVREDVTAPQLFEIILHSSPAVDRGRYFITFSTTDKESGVSHYEVLETDPRKWGFLTFIAREANWTPATSPYILRDQSLRSTIQVKAVDKAGNERIVTYQPPEHLRASFASVVDLAQLLVLLGIVAAFAYLIVRRYRRRPETSDHHHLDDHAQVH